MVGLYVWPLMCKIRVDFTWAIHSRGHDFWFSWAEVHRTPGRHIAGFSPGVQSHGWLFRWSTPPAKGDRGAPLSSCSPWCYYHLASLLCHTKATLCLVHISSVFFIWLAVLGRATIVSIVSRITNINFEPGDSSWLQASLPVGSGGLGFRIAFHLALSAFLASADGASALMQQLLPPHLASMPYSEQRSALSVWHSCLPEDTLPPTGSSRKKQKSWDKPRVDQVFHSLLLNRCDEEPKPVS